MVLNEGSLIRKKPTIRKYSKTRAARNSTNCTQNSTIASTAHPPGRNNHETSVGTKQIRAVRRIIWQTKSSTFQKLISGEKLEEFPPGVFLTTRESIITSTITAGIATRNMPSPLKTVGGGAAFGGGIAMAGGGELYTTGFSKLIRLGGGVAPTVCSRKCNTGGIAILPGGARGGA